MELPDASPAEACLKVLDAAGQAFVIAMSSLDEHLHGLQAFSAVTAFVTKGEILDGGSLALSVSVAPLEVRPLRTILIEDDDGVAELVRLLMEGAGLVEEFERYDRLMPGLERVASFVPDVLILDLGLPDAPGRLQTLEAAVAQWPDIAIVVLSGLSEQFALRAIRAGAEDFLSKKVLAFPTEQAERVLQRVLMRAAEHTAYRRAVIEELSFHAHLEAATKVIQDDLRGVRGLLGE